MSSNTADDPNVSHRWHKNYTRLMPYYYVNHKARFKMGDKEKIVRVRKVIKTKKNLFLEFAEKDNTRKKKQKITNLEQIEIAWEDIEEISLTTLKSGSVSFHFIK